MERQVLSLEKKQMATTFEWRWSADPSEIDSGERVLMRGFDLIADIESQLSEFLLQSPVYRLNRARVGERIEWTPAFREVFFASLTVFDQTNGAFDPGFRGDRTLALRDRFKWDEIGIARAVENAMLGFGAIGKGYALDQAANFFRSEGISDFLLLAGGSSMIIEGRVDSETDWPLGWSWSKDEQGDLLGVRLERRAPGARTCIGVSGVLEQGHHLVGAQTSSDGILSVFCEAESALEADAFSTAAFVLATRPEYSKIIEKESRFAIAWVDHRGIPTWNARFAERFTAPFLSNPS